MKYLIHGVILSYLLLAIQFPAFANDDIPSGFNNMREATRFTKAWADKALLVTPEGYVQEITETKEMCFEFNDFEHGVGFLIKLDGSRFPRRGPISIREFINTDSPGVKPGYYALWFIATGLGLNHYFKEIIQPENSSFKDSAGNFYEIKPKGYCVEKYGQNT